MKINEDFIITMMKHAKEYNCNVDISIDGDGYMSISIEPHEKNSIAVGSSTITTPYSPSDIWWSTKYDANIAECTHAETGVKI